MQQVWGGAISVAAAFFAFGTTVRGAEADLDAAVGKSLFERIWVPAPASTASTDGLGPLFNARSCASCHQGGGRGKLVTDESGVLQGGGAVVRLADADGNPDPTYGHQIQTNAVQGLAPEAEVRISWVEHQERLGDGTVVALRRPVVTFEALSNGPLGPGTQAALRIAPDLHAAARIAQVSESVFANAPLADAASAEDGSMGRDPDGHPLLFARKGTERALADQTALAFSRDLGLSTNFYPDAAGECMSAETACREAPHGAYGSDVEIPLEIVASIVRYLEDLDASEMAEPATGAANKGRAIFDRIGCSVCHTPELPRRDGGSVTLHSDLRLHDVGPGLADPMPTDDRNPKMWRTASLFGIARGLADGRTLLHDGRARSVTEAILWHGGGAAAARDAYRDLSADQRAQLEAFVASQ